MDELLAETPLSNKDAKIVNLALNAGAFAEKNIAGAFRLLGTDGRAGIDFNDPVQRRAIGSSLVFQNHLERKGVVRSEGHNQWINFLRNEYRSEQVDNFINFMNGNNSKE